MNNFFVSVVIPTYNRSKLLPITIESFINQSYPKDKYEIIIADNNSKDNTKEIVEKWIEKSDVPIKYLFESRQGVHYARNTAAKCAKGDILYYTDDDMIADKNLLLEIIRPFQIDIMVGSASGRILPKWEVEPPLWIKTLCLNSCLSLNNLGDNLRIENYDMGVFSCHQAMRRDVFFESGGFNPENTAGEWIGDGETGLNIKIKNMGYKFAYNGASIIYHIIPLTRMTQKYLNKRLANQGNCDSYTEYKKKLFTKKQLLLTNTKYLRMLNINFFHFFFKVFKISIKTVSGIKNTDSSWRMDCAYIFYYINRIKYNFRLIFSEKWRTLVLKDNWLNN